MDHAACEHEHGKTNPKAAKQIHVRGKQAESVDAASRSNAKLTQQEM
jgi:hypothetical protein